MKEILFLVTLGYSGLSTQAEITNKLGSEAQWQIWKSIHGKRYADADVETYRMAIWQANLKVSRNSGLKVTAGRAITNAVRVFEISSAYVRYSLV